MSLTFISPQYLWIALILPLLVIIALASPSRRNPARFYSGLALRMLIFLALILSLAGISLNMRSNLLTTVFVLDLSDSISPRQKAAGETFIRQAIEAKESLDRAAVVVFGEDALVERLSSDEPFLAEISSVPVASRTNLSSALQLAQALFPNEGARRIILLSDGRENLGQAIDQAELAASSQIELSYIPLGEPETGAEVWVDSLHAPDEIRVGQDFQLTAVIESSDLQEATLRIFEEGMLKKTIEQRLLPGSNRVDIAMQTGTVQETPSGSFRRFKVQVVPETDTHLQNNEASAFTIVFGPPAVLVVEGKPGEGRNLVNALQAASLKAELVSPSEMPTALNKLANYDCVALVGVPAKDLPIGVMETLPIFVRDLGKGLVMIGGSDSFGSGGYLRTPLEKILPVDMDVRDEDAQSNLALVLAVDKSGSMGRCHCDNPDLNQSYTPTLSGQPKVDIAKEAVMRAASAIGSEDFLGVVAFDSQPRWAVELNRLPDPLSLERSISAIQAEGQTNLQSGIEAAYQALKDIQARRKHIILMTDGWVQTGDLYGLAQEMHSQGITFSIVAAGEGSAEYLNSLAALGGGEFYPATSIQEVPDIFLKETMKSVGKYVIEEAFYPIPASPSPILTGLDPLGLPLLLGYNGVSAKKTARLDLITPHGDPLLASWQYGLGRSAVWTSDLKGQWAVNWLAWDGFARFAAQLIGWTLPSPKSEALHAQVSLVENNAVVEVSATHQDGSPYNYLTGSATTIDPDLEVREIEIKQISAGKYQAAAKVSKPGVYLVRLGMNDGDQSLGQSTLGFDVPYSPEYKTSGIDHSLLFKLADATGGREINPGNPSSAFTHNLVSIPSGRQIWLPFLILAALLFPLDIALRRLSIRKKDLRLAADWIKTRWTRPVSPSHEPQPKILKNLFEARQRVRQKGQQRSIQSPVDFSAGEPPTISHPPLKKGHSLAAHPNPPDEIPLGAEKDTIARLREVKKRLKR